MLSNIVYWFSSWAVMCVFLFSYNYGRLINYFGFVYAFFWGLFCLLLVNNGLIWYQKVIALGSYEFYNIKYILGFDSLSIAFVVLCVFLLLLCSLIYWNLKYHVTFYLFLLNLSLFLLVNVFLSLDLVVFYIFFEGIVIPMFFIIEFGVVGLGRYMHPTSFSFIHY